MLSVTKKLLRPWFRRLVIRASRSYVAGETLSEAVNTSTIIQSKGYSTTLGFWNADEDSSESVIQEYMNAIDETNKFEHESYVSIKGPAFGFRSDLYQELIKHTRSKQVPLHFDSLSHESANSMFRLIQNETPSPRQDFSCSMPGRWKRSLKDAELAIEMGLIVRVIKGQWPDPENPEADMTAGFLAVVRQLAGKSRIVRIATHNATLARQSIQILREADTKCELELLYGLPVGQILPIANEMRVPVRLYVPYGQAWIPYSLDRVRKQPRMLLWLAKDAIFGTGLKSLPNKLIK